MATETYYPCVFYSQWVVAKFRSLQLQLLRRIIGMINNCIYTHVTIFFKGKHESFKMCVAQLVADQTSNLKIMGSSSCLDTQHSLRQNNLLHICFNWRSRQLCMPVSFFVLVPLFGHVKTEIMYVQLLFIHE